MLGYAGYDKGYIGYYSNRNSVKKTFSKVTDKGDYSRNDQGQINTETVNYKTDLMAIREITGDDDMDFEKYKKMRFNEVKQNLTNIQIINVNQAYLDFYNALKEDAANVKKAEEDAWEKYPNANDQWSTNKRNEMISKARQYPKSSEVRRKLYYALKNGTNDFTTNVYDKAHTQTVTEFVPPEEEEKELDEQTISSNEKTLVTNVNTNSNEVVSNEYVPQEQEENIIENEIIREEEGIEENNIVGNEIDIKSIEDNNNVIEESIEDNTISNDIY